MPKPAPPALLDAVSTRVRSRRLGHDLTQERLAEASGVQAQTISRIERGVLLPSLTLLHDLAVALECSVADLMDDPRSPLAREEIEILDAWRAAGPTGREALLAVIRELRDRR